MTPESDPTQRPAAAPPAHPASGLQRRALLRAGAGVSPVLLSLASAPVSATVNGGDTCVVASSFVSVATFKSRNPGVTSVQCSTRNADFWRDQAKSNGPPGVLNTKVKELLGETSSEFNNSNLKTVLLAPLPTSGPVQTTGELGTLQHLIAMALNLNAGVVTSPGGVTVAYLGTVWTNYKGNINRYQPPGTGIDWGDTEIIAWLRFMMYPNTLL